MIFGIHEFEGMDDRLSIRSYGEAERSQGVGTLETALYSIEGSEYRLTVEANAGHSYRSGGGEQLDYRGTVTVFFPALTKAGETIWMGGPSVSVEYRFRYGADSRALDFNWSGTSGSADKAFVFALAMRMALQIGEAFKAAAVEADAATAEA